MAARQHHAASAAARTTTTSDTPQVKVQLQFTPDANSTYFILAFAIYDGTGTTSDGVYADLYHADSTTIIGASDHSPLATSDRNPFFAMARLQAGASPTQQTYQIRWNSWAGGAAGCSDALIVAIKADAADQWAESLANATSISTTPAAKVSLSFTPASAGEYVILGAASLGLNGASQQHGVEIWDGGTSYSKVDGFRPRWSDDSVQYAGLVKTDSLSGAQSWSLRHWSKVSGTTVDIRNATLLALRADAFEAVLGARNATAATVSGTTPTTHSSVTGTVASVAHLVLGWSQIGATTTGAGRMTAGGTALTADEAKDDAGAQARGWQFGYMALDTPASAGSRAYALQHWRTGASGGQTTDESSIAVLQLGAASGGGGSTVSRLAPDAILASSNLGASPSLAAIQDDPDSPDGSWLEAVADDTATDLRVSFPSPAGNLVAGAGLQEFRALLRKSAASAGTPTVDVQLYEGGTLKSTLLSGAAIASDTGQVVSATWNASSLADASGAGVECRIVATPATGGSTMPSIRSVGAGASMTATGTLSIPFPGTVGAGDLLLIHFCCRGGTTRQHTVPTGWTELFSNVRASIRQAILVRDARATAGEGGSQDVAWTGSGTNLGAVGRMYAIKDTNGQVEGGAAAEAGDNSIEIPSLTTTGPNRLALAFSSCITSQNTGDAGGETGGDYTQIAAEYASSLITIDGQSAAMASAGTISGGVITLGANRDWATRSFAFLPASSGGASVSVDIGAVEWNARHEVASSLTLAGTRLVDADTLRPITARLALAAAGHADLDTARGGSVAGSLTGVAVLDGDGLRVGQVGSRTVGVRFQDGDVLRIGAVAGRLVGNPIASSGELRIAAARLAVAGARAVDTDALPAASIAQLVGLQGVRHVDADAARGGAPASALQGARLLDLDQARGGQASISLAGIKASDVDALRVGVGRLGLMGNRAGSVGTARGGLTGLRLALVHRADADVPRTAAVQLALAGNRIPSASVLRGGSSSPSLALARLADADVLRAGLLELLQTLAGSRLIDPDLLPAAGVTAQGALSGKRLADADLLRSAALGLKATGSALVDADQAPGGSPALRLIGSRHADSDAVRGGSVVALGALQSVRLIDPDAPRGGSVAAQGALAGVALLDGDVMPAAGLATRLAGAAIQDADMLRPGSASFLQGLLGIRLDEADSIRIGSLGQAVAGAFLPAANAVAGGMARQGLAATRHAETGALPGGQAVLTLLAERHVVASPLVGAKAGLGLAGARAVDADLLRPSIVILPGMLVGMRFLDPDRLFGSRLTTADRLKVIRLAGSWSERGRLAGSVRPSGIRLGGSL